MILAFGKNLKKRGNMEDAFSGVISTTELPPQIFENWVL